MRRRRTPTKENPYVLFTTALNYFDPDQRRMIDHIEKRTNCSDYLKRLVLRDMEGIFLPTSSAAPVERQSGLTLNRGLMSGLI